MGCNAYNHSLDCNCGWGGVHYEPSNIEYGPAFWQQESSHTNPNARCPDCGDKVFFYRSSEGGAVYFDSLGPPWPKHPCTDSDNSHRSKLTEATREGWWPFFMESSLPLPSKEGTILYDTQYRRLFTKVKRARFRSDTPIWIRSVKGVKGIYLLSTLKTKNGKTYEVVCDAYAVSALQHTEYAAKFQATVDWLNSLYLSRYELSDM